jgi:hypothetical protein
VGRTNATFRHLLQGIRRRWGAYRRALRGRDQPYFDRLFEHAEAHADAAGYLNPEEPMDAILLSMLLAHERRLADLEESEPGVGKSEPGGSNNRDDHWDDPAAAGRDAP